MSTHTSPYDRHAPEARLVEVVEVTFMRGVGEGMHNVLRSVTAYYSKDGTLLAESDPYAHLLDEDAKGDGS